MTDEERTELVKRLMTSVTLTFTLPGGAQAADQIETDGDRIKELEAENERLRELVQGWHYLAVGPDEMGDYYTQKQLIKASEPYAHPGLRAILGEKQ